MNELAKLSVDANLPTLTKAWEHNGEILGITDDGNLIVVARLTQSSEAQRAAPQPVSRAKRRRQESSLGAPESLPSSTELSEQYAGEREDTPGKELEAPEKVERERGGRKRKEEAISNPFQTS
jgi:hypothetical protein